MKTRLTRLFAALPFLRRDAGSAPEDSSAAAVKNLCELFTKARSEITIVAGRLDANVYASDSILGALRNAVKRKVSVRIGVGPDPDRVTLDKLGDLAGHVRVLGNYPRLHFEVVDNSHVRIEKSHTRVDETPGNTVERNAPLTADYLSKRYETYVAEGAVSLAAWLSKGRAGS